jgi:hypothetical protein
MLGYARSIHIADLLLRVLAHANRPLADDLVLNHLKGKEEKPSVEKLKALRAIAQCHRSG